MIDGNRDSVNYFNYSLAHMIANTISSTRATINFIETKNINSPLRIAIFI